MPTCTFYMRLADIESNSERSFIHENMLVMKSSFFNSFFGRFGASSYFQMICLDKKILVFCWYSKLETWNLLCIRSHQSMIQGLVSNSKAHLVYLYLLLL